MKLHAFHLPFAAGLGLLVASACTDPQESAAHQPQSTAHEPTSLPAPEPTSPDEADQTLAFEVRQAIQDEPTLSDDAPNITVVAHEGTVTLTGTVSDEEDRTNLEAIAVNVPGVQKVENLVEVEPG